MDNVQSNTVDQPAVEVVEACGEWFVRVVEDGKATTTSFEREAFALTFAEGQRIRLRLETITRV
jgi:hypothetical protein